MAPGTSKQGWQATSPGGQAQAAVVFNWLGGGGTAREAFYPVTPANGRKSNFRCVSDLAFVWPMPDGDAWSVAVLVSQPPCDRGARRAETTSPLGCGPRAEQLCLGVRKEQARCTHPGAPAHFPSRLGSPQREGSSPTAADATDATSWAPQHRHWDQPYPCFTPEETGRPESHRHSFRVPELSSPHRARVLF